MRKCGSVEMIRTTLRRNYGVGGEVGVVERLFTFVDDI